MGRPSAERPPFQPSPTPRSPISEPPPPPEPSPAMPRLRLAPAALLLLAAPLAAQSRGEVGEERSDAIRVGRADRIVVEARAGDLRIVGRDDLDEVRVRSRARASSRDLLRLVELRTERSGDGVLVRVVMPDDWRDGEWASLDLEIELPRGARLEVADGSGDVDIRDVGDVRLGDGSGDVYLERVGALRLTDGSGDVRARGVGGDVELNDGSGGVLLEDVRGTVTVAGDGSGELQVRGVEGSVRVGSKGSGDVVVERVRGDFVVESKSSGDIRHRDVGGRVELPSRWSRRVRPTRRAAPRPAPRGPRGAPAAAPPSPS